MRRFFMALIGETAYYVAASGTGDGLSPANPMSPADFLLLILVNDDTVYFNAGDTF